jgi:hypothetical protein
MLGILWLFLRTHWELDGNTVRISYKQTENNKNPTPPTLPQKKKSLTPGACCFTYWLQELFCLHVFFAIFGLG